ncbi:MAG: hypothetical protein ABSG46_12420 [Candidatus Binataceae bacterium]|jgi:hypothetical protein
MAIAPELYFLLDAEGALIAFQEKDHSWAGALAFSSEASARRFADQSRLDAAEVAGIDTADSATVAALIKTIKRRPIRYLLLDLDYQSGQCRQIDFDGDTFGAVTPRQFVAPSRTS